MKRSWGRVAIAAALLAAGLALPALAMRPISAHAPTAISGGIALSRSHPVLSFAGRMPNPVPIPMPRDPVPAVCAADCQLWTLRVATTSPFLVSIRNTKQSIEDGFNVYVYDPSGSQVASADGIGADGQAVVVHPSASGDYTVAVTATYAFDTNAAYAGEARIMSGPTWSASSCRRSPCPILPALRAMPPTDFHVSGLPPVASTPLGFPLPVGAATPTSCYLEETARTGASRCLRFTSEVDNVGNGVLQLRVPWLVVSGGQPKSGFLPGQCEAEQMVFSTDGSVRTRAAGPCKFHPQHAHFHYRDFVSFSLHAVGPRPGLGATVGKSLKESFCLADDGYFGFRTASPNGPRNYVGQPDCNLPSIAGAGSDAWITMGVSPGWGDIYTWDTPDQFIDITQTPPGVYDVVARANPSGRLLLAGVPRPCGATRIRLTATDVSVLRADVPC